jgi:hypothetical protein
MAVRTKLLKSLYPNTVYVQVSASETGDAHCSRTSEKKRENLAKRSKN